MKIKKSFLVIVVFGLAVTASSNFQAQTVDEMFTITVQKVGNGSGVVVPG